MSPTYELDWMRQRLLLSPIGKNSNVNLPLEVLIVLLQKKLCRRLQNDTTTLANLADMHCTVNMYGRK